MYKVVVDSSVVIKWFLVEPYTNQARRILDDYESDLVTLFVPDLLYAEIGNILWKKQRFQGLSSGDAEEIIRAFQLLDFEVVPTALLLNPAYRLAVEHQRTVYDALYLALSLNEQCLCVTADEKLYNAVGKSFPNLIWVADWL